MQLQMMTITGHRHHLDLQIRRPEAGLEHRLTAGVGAVAAPRRHSQVEAEERLQRHQVVDRQ